MGIVRSLYENLTGEQYRLAVWVGVAALPLVALENVLIGPTTHSEPMSGLMFVLACLVSGALYSDRPGEPSRAGAVTGLTAGSVLIVLSGLLVVTDWWHNPGLVDLVGDSWGLVAATAIGTATTLGIVAVITVVVGLIAGTVGERLYRPVGARMFRTEA